ncbi:haloalkane dehalogenase [Candidatus Heimdallarchaeota archaeon B3_Heim]|nr:MAG: haloalkane dehalogenase [Candidatus Heimdallarchaeota archaeon B3_Heim]
MNLIRTPEKNFDNLPGFLYEPKYVTLNGARVHYIDEGSGDVILCLHGEPTYSYLYRKMVKPFTSAEKRVISFDFIGFGRSDKFTSLEDYTYDMHYKTLTKFVEELDLHDITLVVQDWGGLIGLPFAANNPEKIKNLVIMNTGLPSGRSKPTEAFMQWREFVENNPDLPIGMVIELGLANKENIAPEILKAYEAPFPEEKYKVGARAWPLLVPISPDNPVATIMLETREKLKKWNKPALVMFSDKDPITRGADKFFRKLIPTARDNPEIVIRNAGHFLQEEKGEEIADHIINFLNSEELKEN